MDMLEKIKNSEKRLESAKNTLNYKENCLKNAKNDKDIELFKDHVEYWKKIGDRRENMLNILKSSL